MYMKTKVFLSTCRIKLIKKFMWIVSQHNARNFVRSDKANKNLKWEMVSEVIPSQLAVNSKALKELHGLTKDMADYAWYTTL